MNSLLVSAKKGADRVMEAVAEKDDLLLPLNDFKMFKENLKPKFWEKMSL